MSVLGLPGRLRRLTSTDVFCLVLAAAVVARFAFSSQLDRPAVAAWSTVFIAICVQATPYVVLGIVVSTGIAVYVPASFFERVMPSRQAVAVPVAGLAGVLLPGCECGSVPVAASLSRRGVSPGAAVAFMLSSPSINPVVVMATVVAFPGHPMVAVARFVASLLTALVVGWVWAAAGRPLPLRSIERHEHSSSGSRASQAAATAAHDLTQTLGLLVIGAAGAATLNVALPRWWLDRVDGPVAGVFALGMLAVVLAVCSESDAFIAASLTQFSLTARLVFMVVGPAVDVKLIALQAGTFGRRFTTRFAPLTWLAAVSFACLVGVLTL